MLRTETIKHYRLYLPALLVAVVIAVLSLMENPQITLLEQYGDKFWHTMMYVGLALVLTGGLIADDRRSWGYAVISWVVSMGYGGLMELLQEWCTISRRGDWYDWYADMLGAFAGVVLAYIGYWIWKKSVCIK